MIKIENINALDEINKGASMGCDAIKYIIDKVEDNTLRDLLERQYDLYDNIKKKVNDLYPKYNDEAEPHETNAMTKAMTWYGVNMKTIKDHSNSKIAEILVQGTNMGIIEGRKILNNKNIAKDVHDIIEDFVNSQEKLIEDLKEYL